MHPDSEQPPGRGRRSCPAQSHQQRRMRPVWVSASCQNAPHSSWEQLAAGWLGYRRYPSSWCCPARQGQAVKGAQAAPPAPEAAEQAGMRQEGQREATGVTWMGCDRHCEHSVRAARAVGKPSSGSVKGTRGTQSGWCQSHGWLVPCVRLAGALCQAALGQHRGTPTLQQPGAGWGCRLGCQAVQKEQCKVSDSVFLPPDEARHRMSRVPWAAASLSSPGRRARLALLCQSSLGRRTGCFSCCGCAASLDK